MAALGDEPKRESDTANDEVVRTSDIDRPFDDVSVLLLTLDIDRTWKAATDVERRVLVDEFLEEITALPD